MIPRSINQRLTERIIPDYPPGLITDGTQPDSICANVQGAHSDRVASHHRSSADASMVLSQHPRLSPVVGFETEFDVEADGRIYPHRWEVIEVKTSRRIAYRWRYRGYPGDSTVHWNLTSTPVGTELVFTHRDYETLQTGMAGHPRQNCEMGWRCFLDERLRQFLESSQANEKSLA